MFVKIVIVKIAQKVGTSRSDDPLKDINQESCLERSCCWLPLEENSDLPRCFYQETYGKYNVTSTVSDFDVIATPLRFVLMKFHEIIN